MYNLEIGSVIKGFKVERIRASKELGGRFIEMRHETVGTTLHWVDNGDANKLFCVGFKTLPEDSTGVFHILEHSVLCGSKKYPVKEPFVDLMKSSMNTFLNAMTFPDKTIYPVSSRNERDFLNLTEVYLDAIFAPRCVVDPNAFRQEGWRLELNEEGKPYINGVVYNEMKGASSGVDEILMEGMNALLYPDNCYGMNSGGDPAVIPELTYDMYKAMYAKYYHPSNARIFLDGDIPLEKTLDLINEYLGSEYRESSHVIPIQEPKVSSNTLFYEIGAEEDTANRTMLSFGRIIGDYSQKRRIMMTDVLASLLADTNEAPLKRAILDAGLGEDVDLYVMEDIGQPCLTLTVRNTEADRIDEIRRVCDEVISKLLGEGLDKALLTAHLNRYAFRIKDAEEPAGLFRCIMSYQSSLYGGDPILYLENDADVAALRSAVEAGKFDALLRELFDFDKMCVLTVLPSKEYGGQLLEEEAARAEAIWAGMDEARRAELKELNDRLHVWQETPDSEEDTAKMPVLPLSEVSPEPIAVPTEAVLIHGVPVLRRAIPSSGITHLNLYFSLTDLGLGSISRASLMCSLFTKLPTKRHSVAELQREIKTYIGRLRFEIKASMLKPEAAVPYFAVFCDVLDENLIRAEELVAEILTETLFDDPERLREIVAQLDEATKQRMIMSGHSVGLIAVSSHYLSSSAVIEAANGYTYRSFIKDLAKNFDKESAGLLEALSEIRRRALVSARLTVGLTATDIPDVSGLVSALPAGLPAPLNAHYDSPVPERFGVRIPAQVSFAEKGIFVPELDGSMKVAANVITLSHLWNRVRVQGGAYGVALRVDEHGVICHYTYRDPSPARSVSVFSEEPDFIRAFCESGEDISRFIISAVGATEPLRTPAETGAAAEMDYLDGVTYADKMKFRSEMLNTDREKLLSLIPALESCAKDGRICIVGSSSALGEFEDLTVFDA